MKYQAITLRLRPETVAALRMAAQKSAHRTMAALADEILAAGLAARLQAAESDLERLLAAARRVSA